MMPSERLARTDRQLHQDRVVAQLVSHLLADTQRIGSRPVHLVDERQTRHVISLHLPIDRHRLRLHAANGAQHQDGPVQYAETPLHLDREVDVARACRSS